jgi:hypothetical protein
MQTQKIIMETQNLYKVHAFDVTVVPKSSACPILEPDEAARNIIQSHLANNQTQKLYKVDAMTV